jgi:flagellar basal-body rod protein FlgG
MTNSLYHTLNISRQDMMTRLQDLDVVSNNMANVNTAGYKSSRMNFQEMLNATNREGIHASGTQMFTTEGALRSTDNPYDWAIQGEGFFAVKMPDGKTAYTRNGQFNLDANHNIVTFNSFPLIWDGKVPENAVNITLTQDGTVNAVLADGSNVAAGKVQLTQFNNPTALVNAGNNLWTESTGSGKARTGTPGTNGLGTVISNRVEQSNVSLTRELTRMVTDQRAFQLSSKAFQQTDTMIQQAINLRKV